MKKNKTKRYIKQAAVSFTRLFEKLPKNSN